MNLDGRWCDLSVRDFLVVERVWNWTTGLLQLAIISGGAVVVRHFWKRRREAKVKTWAESVEAAQPVYVEPPAEQMEHCPICSGLGYASSRQVQNYLEDQALARKAREANL